MISENNFNQNNLRSSVVDTTLTSSCFLSPLSFDQSGQACFKATAKYSTSLGSGHAAIARGRNFSKSKKGIKLILADNIFNIRSKLSAGNPDFFLIFFFFFSFFPFLNFCG